MFSSRPEIIGDTWFAVRRPIDLAKLPTFRLYRLLKRQPLQQ